jgi:hypothetical protein
MGGKTKSKRVYPAWVKCPSCEDFYCSIHNCHAYDCSCPAIEKWKKDPYSVGGKRVNFVLKGAP